MRQQRILFLGGNFAQIPIIKEAKQRGMYVITCDYLPDNPGHKIADEYHNLSTTDHIGVLHLAKRIKVDFVVAYASDPAAPTAAYVSEKLCLPGNSYQSVRILAEKDLFRAFQANNGFHAPKSLTICANDNFKELKSVLQYPLMIKPTDSSGSKGISKIENDNQIEFAINHALQFSRKGKVIIEEFIENQLADLHGDGFVIDGELQFACLGDHIYNTISNPFNPIGTLWPTKINNNIVDNTKNIVAHHLKLTGFRDGPINIEARVNSEGKIYIMEIGPRSGGHYVPNAIKYATGFDMVKATLDLLTGEKIVIPSNINHHSAYYAIHSDKKGILRQIRIKDELKFYIKEFHQYIKPGMCVESFKGANDAIGVVLLVFHTREEMDYYISNIKRFICINIKKNR